MTSTRIIRQAVKLATRSAKDCRTELEAYVAMSLAASVPRPFGKRTGTTRMTCQLPDDARERALRCAQQTDVHRMDGSNRLVAIYLPEEKRTSIKSFSIKHKDDLKDPLEPLGDFY